jgi:hypothetical protein
VLRLISFATILASCPALGAEPNWFRRPPEGAQHDYFAGVGNHAEENKAYTIAVLEALAEAGRLRSRTISLKEELLISAESQIRNGNRQTTEAESISQHLATTGSWQIVPGVRIVRAQLERDTIDGRYRAYVMLEIPRREPRAVAKPVDALWRSAVIPGWGQIWKKQDGKGYAILATEVALLAGAISTGIMSGKARGDADATAVAADRTYYNDRADTLFYVSLGTGIAAAAVYIYNLLDAHLAERTDVIYQTAILTSKASVSPTGGQVRLLLTF